MTDPIKVLVVDDSAFMRYMISNMLNSDGEIEVIDTARDGLAALDKIPKVDPQVITLDLEMPRMDGLTTLARIMKENPRPVVMLSGYTVDGAEATIKSLELGAVDFVPKPSGPRSPNIHLIRDILLQKVKHSAIVNIDMLKNGVTILKKPSPAVQALHLCQSPRQRRDIRHVVAVGCSTGGPRALHAIIPQLPPDFPSPVVVIQHMPGGFTNSLAQRLDDVSHVNVKEAEDNDELQPGLVLVAPGDYHIRITEKGIVKLEEGQRIYEARPSVDVAFESLASAFGSKSIGVILTGMGVDGAKGALSMKKAGGKVIAQDESSCVIFGMPKQVIEDGNVDEVLALPKIAYGIIQLALQ